MGSGLSPIGPIGNKVLYVSDEETRGLPGDLSRLENQIALVLQNLEEPELRLLAPVVGSNEKIINSPRINEIIDCVLQNPNSSFAEGVGMNTAIINSPRIDEIIDQVLQNPRSRLASGVGMNDVIINSPRINEIIDCAFSAPRSELASGCISNEVLESSLLYSDKIKNLKELRA